MSHVLTKAPKTGNDSEASGLHFHNYEPSALGPKDVLVKFLAAPINPLDVLVLADRYPVKPQHQYSGEPIPGYDGVGEIVNCGGDVTELAPGDLVIPSKFGIGTWRTHAVLDVQSLQKISRPTDLAFAAILRISIAPAFCLVEDMCNLKPGDWIIQNAATSVVAQMVVQFARRRGIGTIDVIRDRSAVEAEAVKRSLNELGADIVVTESELPEHAGIKSKRIMLALDSVFGSSGQGLVKSLSPGGTFVQLGFLGGPTGELKLDANDLFGRQLTLRALRGSAQVALRSAAEQRDLFNWFISLFNAGELVLPALGLDKVSWDLRDRWGSEERVLKAVKRAQQGSIGQRKQVIVFT
jgi:mitochondrial enoyl-[acyl-carrier protein] reductase / trans-2-enoyl-CoA reductase